MKVKKSKIKMLILKPIIVETSLSIYFRLNLMCLFKTSKVVIQELSI